MLKTVATIGSLDYLGTWNASTNSPTLTSGVGQTNGYYIVSVAGNTNLDGITNWNVGDWAIFNGTTWQRIEGGNAETFSNITVTSLTGYMYANGSNLVTASTTIPVANVTGAVPNTVNVLSSGLLSGGGPLTGNVTITLTSVPAANVTGLGTMASQNANSVTITGGSVSNVNIANSTITNYVNVTPTNTAPTVQTGRLWYDSNVDALAFWTSTGYEVNPGQQVDQVCYNNTGSTIPQGTAVYLSGGSSGNSPYITPAIATSTTTANCVGITGQSIAAGATGIVVVLGQVFNYNTTGWTSGQTLYLSSSTAGALTTTQPSNPYYAVRCGFVVQGGSSTGIVFVSVRNVYTLGSNIISPVSFTAFSTTSNVLQLYGYSSGQIADLIDIWTYSGGTKAFAINAAGAIYAGTWNGNAITNAYLANSSITVNGVNISLGGSGTITANASSALTIGIGLSGTSYNGSTPVTIAIANTAVTAGSYGSASNVATVTINAQGQITAASNTAISITASQISTAIPNSGLANSSTTLGNATLTLGSTTSSVGNLTLSNVTISSVATALPNSYLANSSLTIGNTSISLGGTASSIGNLTLSNVTITSGSISNIAIGGAIVTKNANYSATTSDETILANASTGNVTITLPTASGNTGKTYIVKKIDSSANSVIIATTSAQTIDGITTRTFTSQYTGAQVQTDGSNWFVLAWIDGRNGTGGTF